VPKPLFVIVDDAVHKVHHWLGCLKDINNLFEPAIAIKEKPCEPITDFEAFFKSEAARINESRIASLKEAKLTSVQKKIDSMSEILNSLEDKDELMKKSEEFAN